jgi:hypothetical protein
MGLFVRERASDFEQEANRFELHWLDRLEFGSYAALLKVVFAALQQRWMPPEAGFAIKVAATDTCKQGYIGVTSTDLRLLYAWQGAKQ